MNRKEALKQLMEDSGFLTAERPDDAVRHRMTPEAQLINRNYILSLPPVIKQVAIAQQTVKLAQDKLHEAEFAMYEVQQRWAKAVRDAMPHLLTVPEMWIDPDGEHYYVRPPSSAQQPEWAAELQRKLERKKAGDIDTGTDL